MNKTDKTDISAYTDKSVVNAFEVNSLSPLSLFRELHSRGNNPVYPGNSPQGGTSDRLAKTTALPLPAKEPTFARPELERLADCYGKLNRDQRLSVHRRAVYIRTEKGWQWDTCDAVATLEHIHGGPLLPADTDPDIRAEHDAAIAYFEGVKR